MDERTAVILNVNDDGATRYLLSRNLKQLGFEVREAGSGAEALERVDECDLVLLDLALPDMNGFEVCRRIRQRTAPGWLPVIHVSAIHVQTRDHVESLTGGADAYLTYPLDLDLLRATMAAFLRVRAVEQRLVREKTRAEADLFSIVSEARCLLWRAEVRDTAEPVLHWELQVCEEAAAQRFFPLAVAPGQHYGQAWYDARLAEDRLRTDDYGTAQTRAGSSYSQDFRCRDRDGTVRWIREDVRVETVSPGYWRAVGVSVDVTDQKRREELELQLQQTQKMEAVGQLAGGIAHDFNNMLGVITGYSELMALQAEPGSALRQGLEEIRRAADRAAELTRQLLAFSRKQLLEPQVLDPNEVIRGTERMLRRVIGEQIELEARLDPRVGYVKVDPTQLDQVLINLAVNARDAMPQGGLLRVSTRPISLHPGAPGTPADVPPGRYALLEVSDSGCGIAPEVLGKIWEPFFTTKEVGKGTGLGLATVYGVVSQSGGYITVESALAQGTTFSIYLPRVDEPASGGLRSAPAAAPSRGKETVLLVEDEELVRELVRTLLQQAGYRVLEAGSGEEALRIAADFSNRIDLLLTDVVMPGRTNGRILADALLVERPDLRVLYMSGYTDDADLALGLQRAEVAFIQKPFSPVALTVKVREVLDT